MVDGRRSETLHEQIEDLKRMAREEADSRAEVERFVDASRERERRLLKAVAALEGMPLGAGGKPKLNGAAPKAKAKSHDWSVNPATVEAAFEAARRLVAETGEETFTRAQLAKAIGRSPETTRRAVDHLRDQERVRLAGKSGNGGKTATNLYALMPNAD